MPRKWGEKLLFYVLRMARTKEDKGNFQIKVNYEILSFVVGFNEPKREQQNFNFF